MRIIQPKGFPDSVKSSSSGFYPCSEKEASLHIPSPKMTFSLSPKRISLLLLEIHWNGKYQCYYKRGRSQGYNSESGFKKLIRESKKYENGEKGKSWEKIKF